MAARFVAYVSRPRVIALALLCAGLCALCGYVVLGPGFTRTQGWPAQLGAAAAGLYFAVAVPVTLSQLLRTRAVIEIGPEGILWRRWSDERIPWLAITHAKTITVEHQRLLGLWLRTPQAYRSTSWLGTVAGVRKTMGFGDITLTTQGTDRSHDEMLAAVEAFAPQLLRG